MAAIKAINSKAEVARAQAALAVNICAARGLQDVLRTNLGPKGTMKMLVSGAGDVKLTKDGNVLLHEMQIQHPTASLIAKVATAQDDITGDGTTSNVLIIGELLKQADLYISEGLHPRIIAEGFEIAKIKALEVLEQVKIKKEMKREILLDVARTSLQTKVHPQLADVLTEAVVDSVLAIRRPNYPIDLFMVEIMEMKHKSETDTKLSLACGGVAVNSVEDLSVDCLGHAGLVYEYTLGEEKYTFIEDCINPRSVTLLVKGPNKHTLTQIKDAVRDGLRAIKNAIEDGCVVPGAGAVEVAIAEALVTYKHTIQGRARLGVQAFADALLIIPKVLAQNSGYDLQETLVKVQAEHSDSKQPVGIDLNTGEPMVAADAGVWDNYCVKKQLLHSCTVIATNILLVDEIMRAGMSSLKG
ncbi:T-complex protein 1 subunit zeta-2 isoform X7 [Cervus elaphus]|uniref:T-complex protein 1 subunit zeta-2 isoform X9 n=1 Tax=Cervus canadensis TaxID=1574408 RepID=UPI001C9E348A|nr:T-complex protein 1 subunit zeta-2 isoform X9 [Cervus canadensis]XP_043758988.1 T-complex protein 1 subunit zeta-2 isoform X7 [Cervus elaphus]